MIFDNMDTTETATMTLTLLLEILILESTFSMETSLCQCSVKLSNTEEQRLSIRYYLLAIRLTSKECIYPQNNLTNDQ